MGKHDDSIFYDLLAKSFACNEAHKNQRIQGKNKKLLPSSTAKKHKLWALLGSDIGGLNFWIKFQNKNTKATPNKHVIISLIRNNQIR